MRALLAQQPVRDLLGGIFGASPYLTGLMERDPASLMHMLAEAPEAHFAGLCSTLEASVAATSATPDVMRALRRFKNAVALLAALADAGGVWPVMTVTRRLSEAADAAVGGAVRFLFRLAAARGEWLSDKPDGYIVLAMGKYGAFELNYSSDIDLIVFYDLERIRLREGAEIQHFFVRLTRELVRLLHERTGDGYVFRTDLRLRPDPAATPMALSTEAALNYYESFGQNWERAALIKARPVAGDLAAGQALLARSRTLRLAQVSRLCGHRRHSRHETADPRLPRLRRDRRGRPQHQGRARRHPRGGVLRPDPAADRRRAAARAACERDAGGARATGAARLDHGHGRARAGEPPIASCARSSIACR